MSILLSTSAAVVLVTSTVFCTYELITYRRTTLLHVRTVARIAAANCAALLREQDRAGAVELLSTLQAEPELELAALYDAQGRLFSAFPADAPISDFPDRPEPADTRFEATRLDAFEPVTDGTELMGTLYLRVGLGGMYRRFLLYGTVVLLVVAASLLVAYALSRLLQRQFTRPILTLAQTAQAITEGRDYSVRAPSVGNDDLGLLTRAFNQMLTQIQERDHAVQEGAERMRAVLNSALSAVVIADAEARIVDWTARADEVFGWDRDAVLGQDVVELIVPPKYRPAAREILRKYLDNGDSDSFSRPMEALALRADGTEFAAEVSISPLRSGAAVTFCAFITDITERKRWEERTRQLNLDLERRVAERTAQLENLNRELEAFSYSVSHDLRAPLRHIDGFAALLQKHAGDKLDPQGRRFVATISDAARNMGRLIDDLLAFSRTGRAALNLVMVDQDALVADVITEGGFAQKERPVEWAVSPLPPVQADPGLLRLVWMNLVGNAVKYSSHVAKPQVEIGTAVSNEPGEHVFFVRDNGVGFDMKYASKLFGVFQRLHSSTEFEGTGIGLAHVKRIVARHGGRVWAEGRPGAGATFFFTLPTGTTPDPAASIPPFA